ncbi:Uncharacterized protein FWK35_00013756 [Aphis craccivora]|uniref:Uncharacterized protein n=1 Tax=Aphis craccivora TaxID=307492 RepID=A0A6G0YAP9_APHCR|nr:Uncharacterized protein FWK35_00013756 [Aphis craccivora]
MLVGTVVTVFSTPRISLIDAINHYYLHNPISIKFQNCIYNNDWMTKTRGSVSNQVLANRTGGSTKILDSERSEECIDFTMIITSRNNALISNYGGGSRCKSEYPWCIIQV